MKLEQFDEAFEGRGLLLLHSGTPAEVASLRASLTGLVVPNAAIDLHALDFIDAVGGITVTAISDPSGRGVRRLANAGAFVWSLPPSEWENACGLLEPFCDASAAKVGAGFQYLHDHEGCVVIYSARREW